MNKSQVLKVVAALIIFGGAGIAKGLTLRAYDRAAEPYKARRRDQ